MSAQASAQPAADAEASPGGQAVYGTEGFLPELAALFPGEPSAGQGFNFDTIASLRAGEQNSRTAAANAAEGIMDVRIEDVYIDNPNAPGQQLRLRLYRPSAANQLSAVLLWIHGGGMCVGLPEQDEAQNLRFARELGLPVAAVDYRKAPEEPYPAQPDDCYTALLWLSEHLADFNASKIAVGGSSAGGGLTLATVLRARDEGGPAIAFAMPCYPMLSCRLDLPSANAVYDSRTLDREAMVYFWDAYRGDVPLAELADDPYFDPLANTDWSDLPPMYMFACQYDPLRDGDLAFAQAAWAGGVTLTYQCFGGTFHAFDLGAPQTRIAQDAVDSMMENLRYYLY